MGMLRVFNKTLTQRPLLVIEKDLPKTAALLLFGFGTMHTCLLSLNSLSFFIRKLTIAASFAFSLTLLLKNTGALFSLAIIRFTGLITYYLSGFRILNMALFRSIVTSKFLMKSLPKMNWSDSSRFSITRKLIHRLRSPRFRAIIGVLPSFWCLFAADSRFLESIESSLSKPIRTQVSIGIMLKTAPVSSNPRNCVFLPLMSSTCADTSASARCALHPPPTWRSVQSISLLVLPCPRRSVPLSLRHMLS